MGKLISPDYFDPEDKRPIFDWMTVMRQGGIVYVGLDALSDAVVSSAVGNSMLADLVSGRQALQERGLIPMIPRASLLPEVCCHFDEVNEIAGPEFVPMVNKLGGSGVPDHGLHPVHVRHRGQVGDRAKAGQILDNFNHLVMLRVRSVTTANLLAEQVPQVDVVHLTPMSGVTDTAAQGTGVDFTSRNDDIVTKTKAPTIEAADILERPRARPLRCWRVTGATRSASRWRIRGSDPVRARLLLEGGLGHEAALPHERAMGQGNRLARADGGGWPVNPRAMPASA